VQSHIKGEIDMVEKADTSMTIRMNREVKQQAQQIFSDLGMDMTTAINIFLRQAISYKGLPFEVALRTPNKVTLAAMDAAEQDKDMQGPFESVSSLMDALNA
jgi:DNA-damage-inducible protein J